MIRVQVLNDLESSLSFIGTFAHSAEQAQQLHLSGLDEIACLIDFGNNHEEDIFSLCRLPAMSRAAPRRNAGVRACHYPVVTS